MSKISLTPNAAGTGTFSIASPNSNTNRTITLPDEAGELLVNTATGIDVTGTVTATTLQTTAGGTVTTASGNDLNIVYPASRSLFIKEGSETHVTVDNAGNVGIGVTNPSAYYSTKLVVDAEGGEDGITIVSSNQAEAYLMFADGTSGDARYRGYVSYNHTSDFLRFGGTGAERMRLDASGNLLLGKTANDIATVGHRLGGGGSYAAHSRANEPALYVNRNSSNGSALTLTREGSTVGSISVTGSSTAYNTSSDYRLKTDAQPLIGASARVQALNPVNFEWIASGERVDGFLAHEAATVVPESVTGTKDAMKDEEYEVTPAVLDDDGDETTAAVMGTRSVPDYQGIDQSKLVPLLTAALQEALTKIDTMETRLAALESV